MGVLSTILGSGDVISKGLNLIDDMHTSKEEEIVAKTKAKTDLLASYAPFKVAQRYLALIFGLTFVASYVMVLALFMLTIVGFYFGGGAFEGILDKRKEK